MNDKSATQGQEARYTKAADNLRRIQETLAPIARSRKRKVRSPRDVWHETSSWLKTQEKNGNSHS